MWTHKLQMERELNTRTFSSESREKVKIILWSLDAAKESKCDEGKKKEKATKKEGGRE